MILAARGLAFGYRGHVVGRGLDLDLAAGQVLCVLGPNGAGKTTLFRTLLGLIRPLDGHVSLDGRALDSLSRAEVARDIAYVPQTSPMAFDFSLEEIVVMGRTSHLAPFAAPARADVEAARAALSRLGIGALADHSFEEVSGGERQLALIARALASEAGALVMDEPTASLDFGNQARVLDEIVRLREAGIAILLCTHDPDHALAVADQALLLQGGRVLERGPAAAVVNGANLSRLYGIPVEVAGGRFARPAPLS